MTQWPRRRLGSTVGSARHDQRKAHAEIVSVAGDQAHALRRARMLAAVLDLAEPVGAGQRDLSGRRLARLDEADRSAATLYQ